MQTHLQTIHSQYRDTRGPRRRQPGPTHSLPRPTRIGATPLHSWRGSGGSIYARRHLRTVSPPSSSGRRGRTRPLTGRAGTAGGRPAGRPGPPRVPPRLRQGEPAVRSRREGPPRRAGRRGRPETRRRAASRDGPPGRRARSRFRTPQPHSASSMPPDRSVRAGGGRAEPSAANQVHGLPCGCSPSSSTDSTRCTGAGRASIRGARGRGGFYDRRGRVLRQARVFYDGRGFFFTTGAGFFPRRARFFFSRRARVFNDRRGFFLEKGKRAVKKAPRSPRPRRAGRPESRRPPGGVPCKTPRCKTPRRGVLHGGGVSCKTPRRGTLK